MAAKERRAAPIARATSGELRAPEGLTVDVRQLMEERIKCTRCDRMILPVTAKVNQGLCGHCRRLANRESFEETVASWERDHSKIPGTHGIPEPADLALAIRARQMRAMLSGEDQMEKVCHDFFAAAHTKWTQRGAGSLSPKERHVLAVETFVGEMANGGLPQYLGNESRAFANWASEGFERIRISELSELMVKVQALFPNSQIPAEYDACWKVVKDLDGQVLQEIESGFWRRWRQDKTEIRKKLHAYITAK